MNFRPPEIWIVSGPSRPERTRFAARFAQSLERAAHIDGEALWEQIASGRIPPAERDRDPDESDRQYELSIRNQCLLARSYAEAGFTPLLDFPIVTAYHLDAYRNYLVGGQLHLVLLAPAEELSGLGVTVSPDTPAADVLAQASSALLPAPSGNVRSRGA